MKITSINVKEENDKVVMERGKEFLRISNVNLQKRFNENCDVMELLLIKRKWHFEGFINGFRVYSKGQQRIGIGKGDGDIGWNEKFKPHKPVVNVKNNRRWVGLVAGRSNRI